jgi:hypothetical protein
LLENPSGHPLGMKRLERVELFSGADVLDRRAGDAEDRERRATPGVTIHFGEHDPGNTQRLVKALRDAHRVLPGHPVGHQEDFMGIHRGLEPGELRHHLLVDLQPTRRIHQHRPRARLGRSLETVLDQLDHIRLAVFAIDPHVDLAAQRLQLFGRGRPVDVGRYQKRGLLLQLEPLGQLACGRRLS